MRNRESKQEERWLSYKVTQEFIAYVSEGLAPVYISEGADILADPDYWAGWKWNGRASLRFYWERNQYYVDRNTFLNSTQALE
jgi:hypothetical protein